MVELLGGEMGGVIGFDEVSSILSHFDQMSDGGMAGGVGNGEDEDSSQFQVVMKQLGKRDPITKLKV